jgi:hypothetical protein
MAAEVAEDCDLPRGAGLLLSLFLAVTKSKWFSARTPVQQECGNLAEEMKCATKIFKNFWVFRPRRELSG